MTSGWSMKAIIRIAPPHRAQQGIRLVDLLDTLGPPLLEGARATVRRGTTTPGRRRAGGRSRRAAVDRRRVRAAGR